MSRERNTAREGGQGPGRGHRGGSVGKEGTRRLRGISRRVPLSFKREPGASVVPDAAVPCFSSLPRRPPHLGPGLIPGLARSPPRLLPRGSRAGRRDARARVFGLFWCFSPDFLQIATLRKSTFHLFTSVFFPPLISELIGHSKTFSSEQIPGLSRAYPGSIPVPAPRQQSKAQGCSGAQISGTPRGS